MPVVANRKRQINLRVDAQLYAQIVEASRTRGSINKWAAAAFREKLLRNSKGRVPQTVEPHHEDARNDFERTWNRTLNRWLRKPGKWRCLLEVLAEVWKLPDLNGKRK